MDGKVRAAQAQRRGEHACVIRRPHDATERFERGFACAHWTALRAARAGMTATARPRALMAAGPASGGVPRGVRRVSRAVRPAVLGTRAPLEQVRPRTTRGSDG